MMVRLWLGSGTYGWNREIDVSFEVEFRWSLGGIQFHIPPNMEHQFPPKFGLVEHGWLGCGT